MNKLEIGNIITGKTSVNNSNYLAKVTSIEIINGSEYYKFILLADFIDDSGFLFQKGYFWGGSANYLHWIELVASDDNNKTIEDLFTMINLLRI